MAELFAPFIIKDLEIKNRIVMPPMCMYSAPNSVPEDWHYIHYGSRAIGGVGLIIIEATGVAPNGRISDKDLGLWDDSQVIALSHLVSAIHDQGAKVGIQLNHAGRKCIVENELIKAPSPIAFDEGSRTPIEMSIADIKETVREFAYAANGANNAGLDVVEIHAAHGYLLSEFLSPLTNKRDDEYGGNHENRARFLKEVIEAVSEVWPKEKPIFVRISAEDYADGGNTKEDLATMINLIKNAGNGIDVVDVSTGGVISVMPSFSPGYQIVHAEYIKNETGIPVIGGGLITNPVEAEAIVSEGKADLVYIGRELLRNPHWVYSAANELKEDVMWPTPYERAR